MLDGRRTNTLQWAVGTFCALTGCLILVAADQFIGAFYAGIARHLTWWASAFLLSGSALVVTAALAPRRLWTIGAHLFAGGALLLIAQGFFDTGSTVDFI